MPKENAKNWDPPNITAKEAAALCILHLSLAAALFENVEADELQSFLEELQKQMSPQHPAYDALIKFAESLEEFYK